MKSLVIEKSNKNDFSKAVAEAQSQGYVPATEKLVNEIYPPLHHGEVKINISQTFKKEDGKN